MARTSQMKNAPGDLSIAAQREIVEWMIAQGAMPRYREIIDWVKWKFETDISAGPVLWNMVKKAEKVLGEKRLKDEPGSWGPMPTEFPGFGMPVNAMPDVDERFPVIIGDEEFDFKASTLTIREVFMLKFMEEITNKPDWWTKVYNEEISEKWKKEALDMYWSNPHDHADFTQAMADGCIRELREKAKIYEETGLIPVMDYSACAIKSDKLIPDDLKEALKAAVAPFENVPAARKDWHPGSDEKVLDLVHPSLWPLLYGRSRILPDKRITVSNCLEYCGTGDIIPVPSDEEVDSRKVKWLNTPEISCLSQKFQWLPCDVDLTENGAKVVSYINNVHPVKHAALYPVIEKFIERSLPAWDIIYRWPEELSFTRLKTMHCGFECLAPEICEAPENYECTKINRPLNEGEPPREDDEEEDEGYEGSERQKLDDEWFFANHKADLPDIDDESEKLVLKAEHVKKSGFFNGAKRCQVIVKLANIHLTPEKPTYDGGSWHIEGQLNEHICSTALYYYDCDNITECRLDFRTPANQESMNENLGYMQDDHRSIMNTFAINSHGNTLQNIGSVLTRADRMLFFPNVYQHHVSPFELADKTRPGHRKILALFLVDPAIPVISTAIVPPQQRHWWSENALPAERLGKLPPEVTDMVIKNMEFPISEADAKKIREELISERKVLQEDTNEKLKNVEWSFCEH